MISLSDEPSLNCFHELFISFPGIGILIRGFGQITGRQDNGNPAFLQNDGRVDGLVSSSAGGTGSQSVGAFGQGYSFLGPIGGVRRQGEELLGQVNELLSQINQVVSQSISSGTWTIPATGLATVGAFRNEIANIFTTQKPDPGEYIQLLRYELVPTY